MTDVKIAVTSGEERLKNRIVSISTPRAFDETAYHLPVSYALTGIAVHDRATAQEAYARSGNNTIVASAIAVRRNLVRSSVMVMSLLFFVPQPVRQVRRFYLADFRRTRPRRCAYLQRSAS